MRVAPTRPPAPRVYVLRERELRRLRLPRATTPATLRAAVAEYAGDGACDEVTQTLPVVTDAVAECTRHAACEEVAQTLPVATGALRVRVFFCSAKRAVVAFVHEQEQGGPGACIVRLERACELAGAPAAAVLAGLWRRFGRVKQ